MGVSGLRKRVGALERAFPSRCNRTDWITDLATIMQKMGRVAMPHPVVFHCYIAGRTEQQELLLQSAVRHRRQGHRFTETEQEAINILIQEMESDQAAL
jgi:hypothetical protein